MDACQGWGDACLRVEQREACKRVDILLPLANLKIKETTHFLKGAGSEINRKPTKMIKKEQKKKKPAILIN